MKKGPDRLSSTQYSIQDASNTHTAESGVYCEACSCSGAGRRLDLRTSPSLERLAKLLRSSTLRLRQGLIRHSVREIADPVLLRTPRGRDDLGQLEGLEVVVFLRDDSLVASRFFLSWIISSRDAVLALFRRLKVDRQSLPQVSSVRPNR